MLSLDDIIGMSECSEEEIAAVALHEQIPDAVAAELANYIINSEDGVPMLRKIIIEDIQIAKSKDHQDQVIQLKEVLKHFIATHPDYRAGIST